MLTFRLSHPPRPSFSILFGQFSTLTRHRTSEHASKTREDTIKYRHNQQRISDSTWKKEKSSRLNQPSHNHKSQYKKIFNNDEYFNQVPSRFRLSENNKLKLMDYTLPRVGWEGLGLRSSAIEALKAMGIARPNPMQLNIIPQVLQSNSTLLCAAETGSGKTLAYLLPLMEKLKREEEASHAAEERVDSPIVQKVGCPRAVILVPSNELVEQVFGVAKFLSHHIKLRVERFSGTMGIKSRRDTLANPIDIVVCTPGQLLRWTTDLNHTSHLVIDEGDTLLASDSTPSADGNNDNFGGEVRQLLKANIPSARRTTFICSATIPVAMAAQLDELFPEAVRFGSPRLHAASDRISVRFVDVCQPGNVKLRIKSVDNAITNVPFRLHRLITENALLMEQLGSVPSLLHGAIPDRQRQALIRKFQLGEIKYLICTDLASRGLDTTNVSHVIMFDFPRNTIDFIHRMGRTGRLMGSRGLVSCFVSKRDQQLAQAIKQAIRSGKPLSSSKEPKKPKIGDEEKRLTRRKKD